MKQRPIGLPLSRHEGRMSSKPVLAGVPHAAPEDETNQAHLTVLLNSPVLDAYSEEHLAEIQRSFLPMVHPLDVMMKVHNKDYVRWLKDRLSRRSMDDIATWLAQKPSPMVLRYQAYDINSYTFYTKERDKKTSFQNSSIQIECITVDETDKSVYYGTIEEIWELNYVEVKVALFRCKWVPLSQVKVDDYRKTCVNMTKMAYHKDPFILASNAT
jgi:hypothetical protein